MAIHFKQVGRTFAAEVGGVDLRQGVDASTVRQIDAALAQYGVLCFRNQPLDDESQQAFIQQFGPPVITVVKEISSGKNHNPHFYDIATIDEDGNPIADDSARGLYLLANQLWHTDGSHSQPPIRLTALSARVLPPTPPDTLYADMRAAWNELPQSRKAELELLMVEHSLYASREKVGMGLSSFSEDTRNQKPPVVHPLVRTHTLTGQKSLYLAAHASHVVGWPLAEGRALLEELTAFATQPKFIHVHIWEADDLVMWDDSWTMHRATPYSGSHPRMMRWCGVRELADV